MKLYAQPTALKQMVLFICGGIMVVTLLATIQMRVVLGVTPTLPEYTVPIIVGAVVGFVLGLGYLRIRRRESELNRFFDLSIDLLCIASMDGEFLRLNPAFEQILGWPLIDMLAKPLIEFVHPDDIQPTLSEMAKLGPSSSTIQFENRFCCRDGSYKWLAWTARPTAEGQIYAVAHDVTARKEMEESLRDSSKRLTAIVETAVDGIITISAEGVIDTVNPAAVRIFGYDRAEMIGNNVKMLMPSPYSIEHDGYLANYRQTGVKKIIGIGRQVEGLRKDGTIFPLELSVAESFLDKERMFTGIVRDVTERMKQEEILRQSEARNRALIGVIPDAIMRIHRDGTTLDVKAPTSYQSIAPAGSMVGKKQREFLPEPLAGRAIEAIGAALEKNELQVLEYEADIDGETYIREARIIPSDDDETIVMIRDITEQRQVEQAKLAAVVSERNRIARDLHDSVTQTLFSASLIADVLPKLWDKNPDRAKIRVEELRELARGALAEMRTLLLELRPAVLLEADMEELLQQLVNALIGRARVKAKLTVEGNVRNLPKDIHIAIYRTVQEALNNIAKHANATHVTVALQQHSDQLHLTIQDNGKGFDTALQRGGHFGLQNMQERIMAVGGTIRVDSQPEEGTIVFIQVGIAPTPRLSNGY